MAHQKHSAVTHILSYPRATPARQVVASARLKGFRITEAYVYGTRSREKRQRPDAASAEQRFVSLVAEIGVLRACAVIARVREVCGG